MTLVSIVIPTFNNGRDIVATMESVLTQDFDDFEVVIADHSSTDDTLEKLKLFSGDSRVRILSTDAGGGALRNWNRVTAEASGKYLKLVCGDDILDPQCLTRQIVPFLENENVVLVASPRRIIDEAGATMMEKRGLAGLTGLMAGTVAIRKTVKAGTNIFGEPASVMVRREELMNAGGWDGQFPYLIDQTTYTRVLLRGDFFAVPEVLGAFRVSGSQWSVQLVAQQSQQAIAFHEWFREQNPDVVSAFDTYRGNAMARFNALGRRAVYAGLRLRSRLAR
ncbi:MAG: glycosyltransferase family 2 protein [Actinomycetales bacterium]|nr:glycosyltransferase family 2 protein [Actinomycetales bacterium]